jgi:hypothetical protein
MRYDREYDPERHRNIKPCYKYKKSNAENVYGEGKKEDEDPAMNYRHHAPDRTFKIS